MKNPFDPGYYCSEELRRFGFAHVGDDVLVSKDCTIIGLANIEISDNVRIDGNTTLIAASGQIRLGNRVHIHSYCQIGGRGGVVLEDFAVMASGSIIYSASDSAMGDHMVGGMVPTHFTRPKVAPVRMAKHSVLFTRCTVLPGVTMREGALACANSLLLMSVPEWTIVEGTPARYRRDRNRKVLAMEHLINEVEAIAV